MPKGSTLVRDGIRVIQGTPAVPLTRPTLFLRMSRITAPNQPQRTVATLSMARPGAGNYVIKELIPDMDLAPRDALDKAVAIAKRGEVSELYLNADLDKLPADDVAAIR